ncbi:MAG: ABC transporter ATP-binding protein [Gammaproteobacteria bacterium]|nr:ABC transporter ATP-binding protein [Gammaproteobacteria bacterium]
MIAVEALQKTVPSPEGALHILQDIDLEIARGETVAVVGESGSGKTTLIGLMAGLDLPTHGRILVEGRDLGALDEDQRAILRGELVGFVFQSFQLIHSLTALENVMLPLELAGHDRPAAAATAELERVGLAPRRHHYPRQLSGGEQQRVAIARAFATRPRLLFADEPTGNLDRRTGHQVEELLFELNRERGTTLVLVTHDPGLSARCGRELHLEAGRIVGGEAAA